MHLTEDQRTIQQLAREFAQSELAPIAAQIDQEERIPKEIIEKMAEIGFTALNVPEAYGGPELDTMCKVLVVSELAKECASTAEVIAVHTLVNDIFLKHGTDEQKEKYLSAAVAGKIGAFALTEAGAGSDAASAKTKAVVDGDDYVINGSKCLISNMGPTEGDYVVVIALTEPEKGTKGMSAIVVDRGTPGFTVGKREEKLGIRGADISDLIFEDCRVPRSNLIGKEGEGFKIAMAALDGGRIGMAAQGLGIADAAIEASIKYMKERVQFGKPIANLQGLQWYLADMATRPKPPGPWCMRRPALPTAGSPCPSWPPCASTTPPRTPYGSPTKPSRSTAATAICGTIPSSACTGMPGSSPSTRAPLRPRRSSSPENCSNKIG